MRLDTNIDNHEKSQALVGRFRDAMLVQSGLRRDPHDETHFDPRKCTSLPVCIQNRQQIAREISRKLGQLQDEAMGPVELKLLNDEVNALIQNFDNWNYRVRELGGNKHREKKDFYDQGIEYVHNRPYRYFGRAKELPEAKDVPKDVADMESEDDGRFSALSPSYFALGSDGRPISYDANEELIRLESHLQGASGPFEYIGTKRIPTAAYSLLPDFDIPTVEDSTRQLIEIRKQQLLVRLQK